MSTKHTYFAIRVNDVSIVDILARLHYSCAPKGTQHG